MIKRLLSFISRKVTKIKHFCIAFLLPILFFTFQTEEASATHAAGGYLTYQLISGTTYLFTVTFYRDCAGIQPPAEMEIDITADCGTDYFDAPLIAGTGQEIGYPCPNTTTCDGGTYPGYRVYVYQTTATLNDLCSNWVFSFQPWPNDNPPQALGRNNGITTLEPTCLDGNYNQVQCDLYTETYMANPGQESSVTFNNNPIIFICAGQNAVLNLGATSTSGDLLTYSLVNARSDAYDDVIYANTLSGQNPLFPVGSVSINSSTGDISINTSVQQIGVVDVQVDQYRNGVLIGSVIIEFQVVVQQCNNSYPAVSGINNTAVFTDTVCPGNTVNFQVYSSDPQSGKIVTMTWDNGLPAGSFSASGSPYPTGTFTWTTSAADARPQPYTFTVTVQDNNCPVNGFQTRAYSIYVLGTSLAVSPSSPTICNGGSVTLNASGGSAYTWSPPNGLSATTGASVSASPGATTTYTVSSTGNCSGSATVKVTVASQIAATATPADTTVCSGSHVPLNAGGGTSYVWSPSSSLSNPNIANPVATPSVTTTYTVNVTSGSCSGTALVVVNVASQIAATASPHDTSICGGNPVPLNAGGGTSYIWSPASSLSNPNIPNPIATPSVTTTYTVTASAGSCSGTATVVVNITSILSSTAGPDTAICSGNPVTLHAAGGTNYVWSPAGSLNNPNSPNPVATPSVSTTYTVDVSAGGCSGTSTASVTVNEGVSPFPFINESQTGDTLICSTNPGYSNYQWYYETSSNVDSLIQGATSNKIIATKSGNYVVKVYNEFGCSIAVETNFVLGIKEFNLDIAVYLSPNPASGLITLHVLSPLNHKTTATVLNVLGEMVYESRITSNQMDIDLSKFAAGVYFMKVANETTEWNGKFVKE